MFHEQRLECWKCNYKVLNVKIQTIRFSSFAMWVKGKKRSMTQAFSNKCISVGFLLLSSTTSIERTWSSYQYEYLHHSSTRTKPFPYLRLTVHLPGTWFHFSSIDCKCKLWLSCTTVEKKQIKRVNKRTKFVARFAKLHAFIKKQKKSKKLRLRMMRFTHNFQLKKRFFVATLEKWKP